jgi:hypothetical protein
MSTSRSDIRQLLEAMGDATMVLHERYNQKSRIQSLKKQFVCWSEGPLNQLFWSAAFVCPVSGEVFLSGTLIKSPPGVSHSDMCFYSSKKMAVKAAAGTAEDCFRLRDSQRGTRIAQFSRDRPYEARYAKPTDVLLAPVPSAARIEIDPLQVQAQTR